MQDNGAGVERKPESAQAKPEPQPWPAVVALSVLMVCVTAAIVAWIVWG